MEISEVRVKLIPSPSDRLKAFCSVTLDGDFVIRDIKIIEGGAGIFVAMPSRKLSDHCPKCGSKNHLRARYCNECAASLAPDRIHRDKAGRKKLHADIAHPINTACRQRLQEQIIEAFNRESSAAALPGYKHSSFDDEDDDYENSDIRDLVADLKRDAADRRTDKGRGNRHAAVESAEEGSFFDEVRDAVLVDKDEEDDKGDGGREEMDIDESDEEEAKIDDGSDEESDVRVFNPEPIVNRRASIDDFGAGLLEDVTERKPRKPAPPPQPAIPVAKRVVAPREFDDDFGSGIL